MAPPATRHDFDAAACVAGILAAAVEYRLEDYQQLLAEAVTTLEAGSLVRDVVGPVLREAGNRWHRGELSIAQEHLLSAAIRRRLGQLLDDGNRRATGPTVVFATLSGERHEMGSLMLAAVATSRGFRAIDLGPDLPAPELGRVCRSLPVAALAISLVTHPDVIDAGRQLIELRRLLPVELPVWLGGQAANLLGPGKLPEHTRLVRDLSDFDACLAGLTARSISP
jgi:MerR family transcriptional regulator, light-induced transcriptional regulator